MRGQLYPHLDIDPAHYNLTDEDKPLAAKLHLVREANPKFGQATACDLPLPY
jgi:hypothetical protein